MNVFNVGDKVKHVYRFYPFNKTTGVIKGMRMTKHNGELYRVLTDYDGTEKLKEYLMFDYQLERIA